MGDSKDDVFEVKPSTEIDDGKRKFHFASIRWDIANFSRKARKADEEVKSQQFECSDAYWELSVYPNGQRTNQSVGLVVVWLNKTFSRTHEHKAVSEITIPSDEEKTFISKIEHTFGGNNSSCFFSIALPRSTVLRKDLNYLQDGVLTIICNLFVFERENPEVPSALTANILKEPERKEVGTNTTSSVSDPVSHDGPLTEAPDDIIALSKDFEALHENPQLADVILKVGQHEFPAHKTILRSRSKVFEAMFEHDMLENRQDTVDLVEMEAITVKDMLRYIYCGKVRHLSPEDALNLYVAADRYDLQPLVIRCRKIMLSSLSIDNVCDIALVANLHDDQQLMSAVNSLLSENTKAVVKTEKWMTFCKENQSLSLQLIHSVILNN